MKPEASDVNLLIILLSSVFTSGIRSFELVILHTNDIHARFEQFTARDGRCHADDALAKRCYGGVARRSTKVEEIRKLYANVILLDAGDQFQGSPWFNVYKGRAASYFMDQMKYDVMTLGNHEFDNGVEGLIPFLRNVTFPIVCSNMDITSEPSFPKGIVKKYHVLKVGGESIGVIGYITEDVPQLSVTGKLRFSDPVASVQEAASELRALGVNKIIALGHAGIKIDKKLANSVDGLDIVVGGHTNTFLYTGAHPSHENPEGPYPLVFRSKHADDKVLVVQDYAFGKYLGFLKLTFDNHGRVVNYSGNPILMNHTVPEDPVVLSELSHWKSAVQAQYGQVIGETLVYLNGMPTECRLRECNLGNVIVDAMVEYFALKSDLDVRIGLINGGSVRASIDEGSITYEDALKVMPFSNTIDVIELLGADVLKVLEYSVTDYDESTRDGKFLQISGIKVKYDLTRPNGQRVVEVVVRKSSKITKQVEYEPIVDVKLYRVTISSYLAGGGDGYMIIRQLKRKDYNVEVIDIDMFVNSIRRNTPINATIDGRIQLIIPPRGTLTSSSAIIFNSLSANILIFLTFMVLKACSII